MGLTKTWYAFSLSFVDFLLMLRLRNPNVLFAFAMMVSALLLIFP